ncbi:MAG: D-glycero-beta-D-manno-heptose 1-phosphate adenylyltransferase [Candidatus Omnitrophica bacterium]|nr:D-glycero-beta-D-manno-heptose 1-phosphate adenylyltransferase [Candidatus Omnitrophota bacterium]
MRARRRIQRSIKNKTKSFKAILNIIAGLKKQGKRVVFTNGCFDLLHYGHVKYLEDAKRKGDILIVGVNSDSSVRIIKGNNRPITKEGNRLRVIAALESVDFALIFKEDTPLNIIKKIRPDILIKGADWDKSQIVGGRFVRESGGKVLTVNLIKGLSTTNLINKIAKTG